MVIIYIFSRFIEIYWNYYFLLNIKKNIGDLATKFYVIIKGSVNIFLPKTEEEVY